MPYYIDPNLYFKIVRNMEDSFLTDFNMIIEEYSFYQKLTPKMQNELIKAIFPAFHKQFSKSLFNSCE